MKTTVMNRQKLVFNPILIFSFISCLLILSCGASKYLYPIDIDKNIDKRLVGVWVGSEKDQQKLGMEKEWKMERRADGTFTIYFTVRYSNGKSENLVNKGNWWVKDQVFFEYFKISGKTDAYNYEILNKKQVKFKVNQILGSSTQEPNYEFIDTKLVN